MPTTTTRLGLAQPVGTDTPSEIRIADTANTNTLDNAAIYNEGSLAGRPGAGTVAKGTFYRSTDTGDLSYTNGTTWVSVAQVGVGSGAAIYQQGTLASRPAPGSAPAGTLYRATDTNNFANNTGSTWLPVGLAARSVSGSVNANSGELLICAVSTTVTLPAAVKDAVVGVITSASTTGSTAVTVNYGSGGGAVYGVGLGGASLSLGTGVSQTILQCTDGANWVIISGQQDTGWTTQSYGLRRIAGDTARGTATVTVNANALSGSLAIAHGLGVTPTVCYATCRAAGNGHFVTVFSVGSTNLTLNAQTPTASGSNTNVEVDWIATA